MQMEENQNLRADILQKLAYLEREINVTEEGELTHRVNILGALQHLMTKTSGQETCGVWISVRPKSENTVRPSCPAGRSG